jgi:hypothetical protein
MYCQRRERGTAPSAELLPLSSRFCIRAARTGTLLLSPPDVERRPGNTQPIADTGNAVGLACARGDRGRHYRDLRRAKGSPHAPPAPARPHSPSSVRRSASSPPRALRSADRPHVPAMFRRSPITRARASPPAGRPARPIPATGSPPPPLATDEAPARACAQRSNARCQSLRKARTACAWGAARIIETPG